MDYMDNATLTSNTLSAADARFDVTQFVVLRIGGAFLFHTSVRNRSAGQTCQFLAVGLPFSLRWTNENKGKWGQIPALQSKRAQYQN